jgi:hypothetical protein
MSSAEPLDHFLLLGTGVLILIVSVLDMVTA